MQFFEGCSDGTFEMSEDWLVECILCGQQHRIDRRFLNISIMEMFLNIISGQNSLVKVVGKGCLSAQKSIAIKTAISSENITNVMMLIIYNHQ